MNQRQPIYTEKTECRDCYKCVRACPVKAIRVDGGSAVVMHDRCIFCGRCVDICPANAKRIRNDLSEAKRLVASGRPVYVSLAPSFCSEYPDVPYENLILALKRLGFSEVSETALGAQLVVRSASEESIASPSLSISSACPTVVELIRRYYPDLVRHLPPVISPLGAHARLLRELYGQEIGIVFIGPCIAKKLEADRTDGLPDVSLTFREFDTWLKERQLDLRRRETLMPKGGSQADPMSMWFGIPEEPQHEQGCQFVPCSADHTASFALSDGMVTSMARYDQRSASHTFSVSGIKQVMATLEDIETGELSGPLFLELLSCEGGCICGPGCSNRSSLAVKQAATRAFVRDRQHTGRSELLEQARVDLYQEYGCRETGVRVPEAYEIEAALKKLGKQKKSEQLDCGGCGYWSCRDFAAAYVTGMAEVEMCVTKMRKQAQSKVDVLLKTLPMGIVIVDSSLSIVECNAPFLSLFAQVPFEVTEQELSKVRGMPVKQFVDLTTHFRSLFDAGRGSQTHTVTHQGRICKGTFFSIENCRLAGALFQDVTETRQRREAVMRRAEEVIEKNLQSVQMIASLLGENAAETEIMLSSLIDVFEQGSGKQEA